MFDTKQAFILKRANQNETRIFILMCYFYTLIFTALLQLNGNFGKEVHSTSEASKQVCILCSSQQIFYF